MNVKPRGVRTSSRRTAPPRPLSRKSLRVSEPPRDCYSLDLNLFRILFPDDPAVSLFAIAFILIIAAGGAAGLVFIGVLIQWSLRKALPSRPAQIEIELAPQVEPAPALELAPEPNSEPDEPIAIAEPEPPPPRVAPPPPPRPRS